MKKLFCAVFIIAMGLFFTSCASIFTKNTYPVTILTRPDGASVAITDKKGDEVFVGSTPAVVPLKSSSGFFSRAEYIVKINLPGYHEYVTTIGAGIEGWYFGNILFGGLIGMLIVDPATGAMWSLDRERINITLEPLVDKQSSLEIWTIDDIPAEYKDQLVRIN